MKHKTIPTRHKKQLESLGIYFKELRFGEGLSQNELSHNVQIHRKTIQRLESGQNITLLTFLELAEYFEIYPLKELIGDL